MTTQPKLMKGHSIVTVGVIHRRHCRYGEAHGDPCKTRTRLCVIVPCEFGEDGESDPGLAAVPICAAHLEKAAVDVTRQR